MNTLIIFIQNGFDFGVDMLLMEVAVSCLNKDIFKIQKNFKNIFDMQNICIHIIHQVNDDFDYDDVVSLLSINSNLRYSRLDILGLPFSRNFALENCSSDLLIPTDSDVVLFDEELEKISSIFENYPEIDYVTLESFYDPEKLQPRRGFKDAGFTHSKRSLLSVSSIEIVIKVKSFKETKTQWDLDFGLGAKFSGGLETVMLQNAYSNNLKGKFFPIPLSYHHELSTGTEVSLRRVFIRSAVFEKIFGKTKGKFLSLLFHVKNFNKFKGLGVLNLIKTIVSNKHI